MLAGVDGTGVTLPSAGSQRASIFKWVSLWSKLYIFLLIIFKLEHRARYIKNIQYFQTNASESFENELTQ